jgi:hypothetical protein
MSTIEFQQNAVRVQLRCSKEEAFSLKEHLVFEKVNDSSKLHLMYYFCKNFDKLKYHLEDLLEVLWLLPNEFLEKSVCFDSVAEVQKRMNYLFNILTKGNYPFFFEFFYCKVLAEPTLTKLLVYVQDYINIFETFITVNCKGQRYYDKED